MPRTLSFSVAVALYDHLVGIVREPIDGALGEDGVVEQGNPLVDGAVAGDDGGSAAVAFEDDLVEIAGLLGIETTQAEVVDDEHVGGEQAAQDFLGGVIGTRLMQTLQEVIGAQETHLGAGATGRVPESAGEEGLSDADGTEEDYVLVTFDKSQREEIADAIAVEGDRGIPIETLEGVLFVEAGLRESNAEVLVIAPIDLILQYEFEQIELGDLLFAGIGDAVRERRHDPGQLQTLENALQ